MKRKKDMKRKNTLNKVIGIVLILLSLLYIFSYIFIDKMGIFGDLIIENTNQLMGIGSYPVSYTHLRAHET